MRTTKDEQADLSLRWAHTLEGTSHLEAQLMNFDFTAQSTQWGHVERGQFT